MASPSPSPSATSSSWSLVSDTAMARCHHRCASEECPNRDDRQGSNVSMRSSKELSVCQTQHLWECMLDLQESYACYNSTRIDMALDARDQAMEFMRMFNPRRNLTYRQVANSPHSQ